MSRTRDSGGVPLPEARTSASEVHAEAEDQGDWGVILFLIGIIVVLPCAVLMMFVYDEPAETGWNLEYVKRAAKACTPISHRIDEMLADGRVTDDERSIVLTLRDQARAAPGGLADCKAS